MIRFIIFCFGLMLSADAPAFKFEVESKVGKFSPPVHETLTINSVLCFMEWQGQLPESCDLSKVDINEPFPTEILEITPKFKVSIDSLANAASFPDDPGRTESLRAGAKSLVLDKGQCLVRTWWTLWFFKADYSKNITGGLFCSSHFGVLQFLHSMASEEMMLYDLNDGDYLSSNGTESYEDTVAKILGWATLLERISTDDEGIVLNSGIYSYFNGLDSKDAVYPIGKYFAIGEEYNYKHTPPFLKETNKATGKPYQVKFFFNNQCSSLITYTNCWPLDDHNARLAAIGSLFHLIQDSYSASHTFRGVYEENESVHAKISCKSIKQYSTYRGQDVDMHGAADAPDMNNKITFDQSCFDKSNPVHDPILAGAVALWYIVNNASNNHESLIDYLQTHVFTSPYGNLSSGPKACAGNFDPYTGKC